MTDYKLPKLEVLDSATEDYVARLDSGIEYLEKTKNDLRNNEKKLFLESRADLRSKLSGIEGCVLEDNPGVDRVNQLAEEKGMGFAIVSYKLSYTGQDIKGFKRRVEDIQRDHSRSERDRFQRFDDELTAIKRKKEDYIYAALKLTKFSLLHEGSMDNVSLHFYIIRQDGVYESHGDMQSRLASEPAKSSIDPKLFLNDGWIDDFKRQAEGIETTVCMVTNPCKSAPLYSLFEQAKLAFYRYIHEKTMKEIEQIYEEEARKPLAQRLVEELKAREH